MARVTHKWVGEPHASESVKLVDGVPVARNLVPNPSFEVGEDGYTSYLATNVTTTTGYSPPIGDRTLLVRYTDDDTWSSRISLNWGFDTAPSVGKYIAVSSMAREGAGNSTRIRHSLNFGGGGWHYGDRHPNDSRWTRFSESAQIPEGATALQIVTQVFPESTSETPEPIDVLWNLDGYHVAIADTEADALAQVAEYFDGDTEDYETSRFKTYTNGLWVPAQAKQFDGDSWVPAEARRAVPVSVTHEWAGEPHASESIKRVDGVEVARNLALSPRGRDNSHWGYGAPYSSEHDAVTLIPAYNGSASLQAPGASGAAYAALLVQVVHIDGADEVEVSWTKEGGGHRSATLTPGWNPPAVFTDITGDNFFIRHRDEEPITPYIRVVVVSGNSEAEVLAQAETYFDGDTEDYDTVSFSDP